MRKRFLFCLLVGLWLSGMSPAAARPLRIAEAGLPVPIGSGGLIVQQNTPNDPLFNQQFNLSEINIPAAWDITTGSPSPIAIIDTGIDLQHTDLVGKLWTNSGEIPDNGIDDDHNSYIDDYHGYNFLNHDSDLSDVQGHGTGIASIIAAQTNNGIGMAGINWQAPLMILKALNAIGGGDFGTVSEAIRYAADNGARLINMSFGSLDNVSVLQDAVNYAIGKNVIIVAAVGNNNGLGIYYPAHYSSVIAVSSINDSGQLSRFSNYGPGVDIAAPGENILMAGSSANGISSFIRSSGSSFSAAEVTGVVSLMLARNPNLTPAQAESILMSTADPLPGDDALGEFFGAGRVNAGHALSYLPRVLRGRATASNTSPAANGSNAVIISLQVTNDTGQSQTQLPTSVSVSGTGNLINGQAILANQPIAIGQTDQLGQLTFTLGSTLGGLTNLSFTSGNDQIVLPAPLQINFQPATPPIYHFTWLAQSSYPTLYVGDSATLWLEIRNDGNVAWTSDSTVPRGQLKLGTDQRRDRMSSFYDPTTWLSSNRLALMSPASVPPGSTARFTFTIRASRVGRFKESVRPVAEYVSWLSGPGIYWYITVRP